MITDKDGTKNTKTELFRSVDDGMSYVQENAKVNGETLNSESLLKNTFFPERVCSFFRCSSPLPFFRFCPARNAHLLNNPTLPLAHSSHAPLAY